MLGEKDMNDKDLRVIKTKKALTSSLYALLEIESFSSITVHKICENAGIHRTTFYKHFYDKYELLVYLLEVIGKNYFAIDIKERINRPFQVLSNSLNRETLSRIEHMQEEDNEYNKVRNQFLIDIIKNDFYENMDRIALEETIPKSLVFYVFGSIIGGFLEWQKNEETTLTPKEMDEIFHKLVNIKTIN